jgi:hypothetical protein
MSLQNSVQEFKFVKRKLCTVPKMPKVCRRVTLGLHAVVIPVCGLVTMMGSR